VLHHEGFSTADLTEEVDIEKRWRDLGDALEQIVPPSGVPLAYVVVGGVEIGEDLGYGPLRYVVPSEVAAAGADLASLSVDDFRRAMAGAEDEAATLSYLWTAFETVRNCYVGAAAKGFGVLLHFG
jgi:hypothetical protein